MNDTLALSERMRPMLEAAKSIYGKILLGEEGMLRRRDSLCWRSWQLGRLLSAMKAEIGHGKWLFWLGGNWPELSVRSAQRCMLLFCECSNAQTFADLSAESVRKFMFGYVPGKERVSLPGDQPIAPTPHQLTFVNHFHKWERQIAAGHLTADIEIVRRDVEPMARRMIELLGRDWFASLL